MVEFNKVLSKGRIKLISLKDENDNVMEGISGVCSDGKKYTSVGMLPSGAYESEKIMEVENKLGSTVQNWESEKSEKRLANSDICGCGKKLVIGRDKVALFEHISASGKYNFNGCRIPIPNSKLNIQKWREKLLRYEDSIVCDLLEFGFPLDINKSTKLSFNERRNHKGAREFPEFIDKYLERECDAMRIVGPFSENPLSVPLVVSPMNTVPKSSADERRVIVDLSWPLGASVNEGISKEKYLGEIIDLHYASVEQVCEMVLSVGPGAVIYKRDLRHAYRQIPVDPADYCYLGYFWKDLLYFDTVLAMGQRNAAMACTRTTKSIMFMHGEAGYLGTNYLDDLIGVANYSVGTEAYEHLGELLEELGLLENLAKACPPSTVQLVLGVEIDTVNGTISVPVERMVEIVALVGEWQVKKLAKKVDLQSLIGKLQFVTKCVRQSRVFMNRLLEALRSMSGDKKFIKLNDSFKKDLKWWSMFIEEFNGVSFIPPLLWTEPDLTLSTDSCLTGCGGVSANEYFHVLFPKFILDQKLPIHALEMLAVLIGVRIWGQYCTGLRVQIYCDNDACVQVINSSKTKDAFLGSCLRELWLEVSKFGFELRAVHLAGEENRVADWLSRWNIHPKYQRFFHEFIGTDEYTEVYISPDLLELSGDL